MKKEIIIFLISVTLFVMGLQYFILKKEVTKWDEVKKENKMYTELVEIILHIEKDEIKKFKSGDDIYNYAEKKIQERKKANKFIRYY